MSHWLCLHSDYDATIHCWWHNKCITGGNNCDVRMWKMISNSLHIDFIHGHYHGWSYKKVINSTPMLNYTLEFTIHPKEICTQFTLSWVLWCLGTLLVLISPESAISKTKFAASYTLLNVKSRTNNFRPHSNKYLNSLVSTGSDSAWCHQAAGYHLLYVILTQTYDTIWHVTRPQLMYMIWPYN